MNKLDGYYTTLDLITNTSSFEGGRKAIASLSAEGKSAMRVMEGLQKEFAKHAASFGFGGGSGGRGGPPYNYSMHGGFKSNPESGYIIDEPDQKRKQTKQEHSTMEMLARLYLMYKAVNLIAKTVQKIADMTYETTRQNMMGYTQATRANMSPQALKAWSIAASMNAQDSSALIENFTNFNKAFAELATGKGDAFGRYATSLSLLSSASGVPLDPAKMITMSNDERISSVMKAAKTLMKSDKQTAMRLLEDILGPQAVGIAVNDVATGADSYGLGLASQMVTPNAKSVAVGQQFGLLKSELDEMWKLLGESIGERFLEDVKDLNAWLRTHKGDIQKTTDAIADGLGAIVDSFKVLPEFVDSLKNIRGKWNTLDEMKETFSRNMDILFGKEPGTPEAAVTPYLPSSPVPMSKSSSSGTWSAPVFNIEINGANLSNPSGVERAVEEGGRRAMIYPTSH
jgi:hypothetical protein